MSKEFSHFTFPITMLPGAFEDVKKVCDNIFDYCGYAIANKLNGDATERMEAASKHMNITWGNLQKSYSNGCELYHNTPMRTPMTSISKNIIWDFYSNDKTEFDIACFLAFAAIRSILQTKPYCRTNKAHIHARMFGYRSKKEMPEIAGGQMAKYAKRWQMDKIIKALQFDWHLKTYSDHTHCIYVGFKDADKKAMVKDCQVIKKKNKERKLRAENERLKAEVLKELKKEFPEKKPHEKPEPQGITAEDFKKMISKKKQPEPLKLNGFKELADEILSRKRGGK